MCKWSLLQAFISDCDTSIQTICLNYVGVVKFINVTSWQWGSGSELTNILFFIICARCALKKIDDLYNSCIKRFCLLSSSKETSSQFPVFWRKNRDSGLLVVKPFQGTIFRLETSLQRSQRSVFALRKTGLGWGGRATRRWTLATPARPGCGCDGSHSIWVTFHVEIFCYELIKGQY